LTRHLFGKEDHTTCYIINPQITVQLINLINGKALVSDLLTRHGYRLWRWD